MIRIISIAIFIFPLFAMGQTLSDGNEFLVDERQRTNLTDGGDSSNGSAGSEDLEGVMEEEGFVTQQGGLQGTNDGQSKGSAVQMLGMAMGAGFAAICPQMGGQWACPLAAMSFMDAMSGGSAKQAAFETGTYIDPTHGGGGGDYDASGGGNDIQQAQAEDALSQLAEMGYTTNSDGSVTGPDGQTFTADDFASLEKMMNNGMSAGAAQAAMDKIGQVKEDAAQKAGVSMGEAEAAVGGAVAATSKQPEPGSLSTFGASNSSASKDKFIEEVEYRHLGKKKNKRLPASEAANLSKNYNGDPIGIGMANLFLIVHKKYTEKKTKKEFFNSEY